MPNAAMISSIFFFFWLVTLPMIRFWFGVSRKSPVWIFAISRSAVSSL